MIHIAIADVYWQSADEVNVVDEITIVPFRDRKEFEHFASNPLTDNMEWLYLPDLKNVKVRWQKGGLSLFDRLMQAERGNLSKVNKIISFINYFKSLNKAI